MRIPLSTRHLMRRISQVTLGSIGVFTVASFAHSLNKCSYSKRWRLLITSPDEEIDMGNRISHSIVSSTDNDLLLSGTHPLARICQKIVDRLVVASNLSGGFRVVIISDSRNHSIALPNGDIIIHAGLIGFVESESELAGVLSREIAHSILRHGSEVVTLSDLARIPSGFLYSLVPYMGSYLSSSMKWFAVQMAQPDRILSEIPMSDKLINEANRLGLKMMASSGFNPNEYYEYLNRGDSTSRRQADSIRSELESYNGTDPLGTSSIVKKDKELTLRYWIDEIRKQVV
jgi:predicted Zn-dependent protease